MVVFIVAAAITYATLPKPSHPTAPTSVYLTQAFLDETGQPPVISTRAKTARPDEATLPGLQALILDLANQPSVAEQAAAQLGLKAANSPSALNTLRQEVGFTPLGLSEIVIKAKAGSAAKSQDVARAFAAAVISAATKYDQAQQVTTIHGLQADLASLDSQIEKMRSTASTTPPTTATSASTLAPPTRHHSTATTLPPAPASGHVPIISTDPTVQAQFASLLGQYGSVDRQLLTAEGQRAAGSPLQLIGVQHSQKTTTAASSKPISRHVWAAGGLAIGLGAGLLLALLLAALDRRVRDGEAVEALCGLPVIAEIPRRRRRSDPLVVAKEPLSIGADRYRLIRSGLERLPALAVDVHGTVVAPEDTPSRNPTTASRRADGHLQVLGVVGSAPRSGCTTVVANLAVALTETGFHPLAVDANLRAPALHDLLGTTRSPGNWRRLAGRDPRDRPAQCHARPGREPRIQPSGAPAHDRRPDTDLAGRGGHRPRRHRAPRHWVRSFGPG